MEISVVIPTRKRPEYLRSALSSVAAQTRLGSVCDVIVSENGNDERSKDVCSEFTKLPIRYVTRCPELEPVCHFETIVAEASGPWVALLGDDDMWGRYHIEEAERALALYPEIIAFVGGCAIVRNESRRVWGGFGTTVESILWPSSNGVSTIELWSAKRMYLESLVRTPLNIWGVVARKSQLLEAISQWRRMSLAFDADRIFLCNLASQGPLAVGREIGVFYRVHPESTCAIYWAKVKARDKACRETTRTIIANAEESGIDIRKEWRLALESMNYHQRREYLASALPGTRQALAQCWGKDAFGRGDKIRRALLFRRAFKSLCPPFVWDALKRARQNGGGEN
jgi:hypothetical protein